MSLALWIGTGAVGLAVVAMDYRLNAAPYPAQRPAKIAVGVLVVLFAVLLLGAILASP